MAFPPAEHTIWDDDAGRVVRPYTVTTGRTGPATGRIELTTLVAAVTTDTRPRTANPEAHQILRMCHHTVYSVAELAAHLDLPPNVVRVLLGDLMQAGLVAIRRPAEHAHTIPVETLEAVLNGLRAL
jgi:DNA-binding transcriptional ArsR family regulator